MLIGVLIPMFCYAETWNTLYVVDSKGEYTEMQFIDNPTVRFDGTKLLVSSQRANLEFDNETVTFTKTKPIPGGVDNAVRDNVKCVLRVHDGYMEISGLTSGSPITVLTVSGIVILSDVADANGHAMISIPSGYQAVLVVTGSQTFKVIA